MLIGELQFPYRLSREATVYTALLHNSIKDELWLREAIYQSLADTFFTCLKNTPVYPHIASFMQDLQTHVEMFVITENVRAFQFIREDKRLETIALAWTQILHGIICLGKEEYTERFFHDPYLVLKAVTLDTWVELFTQTFTEKIRVKPTIGSLFLEACRKGNKIPDQGIHEQYLAVGATQDYFVRTLAFDRLKSFCH